MPACTGSTTDYTISGRGSDYRRECALATSTGLCKVYIIIIFEFKYYYKAEIGNHAQCRLLVLQERCKQLQRRTTFYCEIVTYLVTHIVHSSPIIAVLYKQGLSAIGSFIQQRFIYIIRNQFKERLYYVANVSPSYVRD